MDVIECDIIDDDDDVFDFVCTDRETRVKPELVRHVGGKKSSKSPSRSSKSSSRRREGDDVEARIRGRWKRGKVERVNRDSYDVDVDGRLHRDIPEDDVRELRGRDGDSDGGGDDDEFKEGMKVEARFKGRSRWFPATIKFIRRDGTMDLLYDDGGECD